MGCGASSGLELTGLAEEAARKAALEEAREAAEREAAARAEAERLAIRKRRRMEEEARLAAAEAARLAAEEAARMADIAGKRAPEEAKFLENSLSGTGELKLFPLREQNAAAHNTALFTKSTMFVTRRGQPVQMLVQHPKFEITAGRDYPMPEPEPEPQSLLRRGLGHVKAAVHRDRASRLFELGPDELRMRALFERWDADGSGFLEVAELNRVEAMYNGEDWDKMNKKERARHGDHFLSSYDDNGARAALPPYAVRRMAR